MNKGFNELWPTTAYLGEIDSAILDTVCQTIFSEIDLEHPISDFQSFDLLNDGSEVFQHFRDIVIWPAFSKYLNHIGVDLNEFPDRRLRSWITGVYNGYSIPVHNHSGASFSAVFYLLSEETDRGGELILLDSRANANRGYKDQFKKLFENKTYLPKSGEYLIFPSHVYHHTTPFTGSIRLAMPVDLLL
jgi:hypothetical protein